LTKVFSRTHNRVVCTESVICTTHARLA